MIVERRVVVVIVIIIIMVMVMMVIMDRMEKAEVGRMPKDNIGPTVEDVKKDKVGTMASMAKAKTGLELVTRAHGECDLNSPNARSSRTPPL